MSYYGIVNVAKKDLAKFMNEVKPSSALIDMSDEEWVAFEFESQTDFINAEKWVYSNYEFEMTDSGYAVGCIYYHKNCGYGFYCDKDGHEEQGFSSPVKAEDAFWDYFDEVA